MNTFKENATEFVGNIGLNWNPICQAGIVSREFISTELVLRYIILRQAITYYMSQ